MVFLVFVSLLVSCATPSSTINPDVVDKIPLTNEKSVGQTFVADFDGLTGIQIYLETIGQVDGELILDIMSEPTSEKILGSSKISIHESLDPKFHEFGFSAFTSSTKEYYYARLYFIGSGTVNIGIASSDSYLNGAFYVDDQPQDLQMAFNLLYDAVWSFLGLIKDILLSIKFILFGIWLFVVPGWGILTLLWSGWDNISPIEKLLLSSGLSVAIYPIIFLWLDLFGLHMGALVAWVPGIIGIVIIAWHYRHSIRHKKLPVLVSSSRALEFSTFIFLIVVILVFFTRFWGLRFIDVPLWGDSYHHTMISQLIVDNGGLFDSWEPYADLNSFTYHFGFHSSAAIFHWLTGAQLTDSVLWVGQILNVIAVLSIFPLAKKLGGNLWAGIIAVITAGLLFPLPMVYANWGRYTQLTGQVILPVMMYFVLQLAERDEFDQKALVIPSILIAGIALSHYRILFFALFFMIILIFFYIKKENYKSLFIKFILIGLGSFILFLPWLIRVYGSTILQIFGEQMTTSARTLSQSTIDYNAIGNLSIYLPIWAWIVIGVSIIIGIFLRQKSTLLIVVWSLFLLIGTNPNWIGLPGAGALSNFALFIAVYIPAALIVGSALGIMIVKILNQGKNLHFLPSLGIMLFVLAFSLLGAQRRLGDIKPDIYALAVRPDVRASTWIKNNLPKEAKFLVNSFLAYNGTLAVGSDGGLWLPLLAERSTTLPPITYGFEEGVTEDSIQNTNQLISMVYELGPTNPGVIKILQEQNITHVYVGQRGGRVNYSGPGVLDPKELAASPYYETIYHQDLVWIFQIMP